MRSRSCSCDHYLWVGQPLAVGATLSVPGRSSMAIIDSPASARRTSSSTGSPRSIETKQPVGLQHRVAQAPPGGPGEQDGFVGLRSAASVPSDLPTTRSVAHLLAQFQDDPFRRLAADAGHRGEKGHVAGGEGSPEIEGRAWPTEQPTLASVRSCSRR